jgi:ClpP class serine protease
MSQRNNSWSEILNEVQSARGPDPFRRKYLRSLHKLTGRNVISYCSGWLQKMSTGLPPAEFSINDNDKNGFMSSIYEMDKRKGLDLILHTPGGNIGATESIVAYLHSVFGTDIRVVVPQLSMSAGTLIALAAKSIVMGKQSSLGPIDPQINGAPAGAIIDGLRAAFIDMRKDPAAAMLWQPMLAKYSPHLVVEAQQAQKWAESLADAWLKKGMFAEELAKDKEKTEKHVGEIVKYLSSHSQTLSHDRHVSADDASGLGLKIELLEKDQDLQDAVLRVHHCNMITFAQTNCYKFVENHEGRGTFNQMQVGVQLQAPVPAAPPR